MVVIDYVIVAIVLISALVSFARGFLREVLSLIAWAGAIVFAFKFAPDSAPYFSKWLADASMQYWAAVVVLFLAALLTLGIINWLIGQAFNEFGSSGMDRSLGILLGAGRGVLVAGLLLLGAGLLSLPVDRWGEGGKVYPHFAKLAEWMKQQAGPLADDLGQHIGPPAQPTSPSSGPSTSPDAAAPENVQPQASQAQDNSLTQSEPEKPSVQ